MQQDNLAARFWTSILRAIDRALHNLISRNAWFPVAGIDTQPDHDVTEILRANRRLDFFRPVGFGVSEIRRTKQHRRSTSD